MIDSIVSFFNKLIAGMNADIVLAVTFGALAAVFAALLCAAIYPKRFLAETENVLAAMRDHPEDTGRLDVCMGRFPGEVPELWKKYRSGGTADVGLYIDQNVCVEAPMSGRAMRVIGMGMATVLIAAIALALGVAVGGNAFNMTAVFPSLVVLLSGIVFMSVLHVVWGRRYKKVLRSYYTLIDLLTLNLPRRGMLFLPPAGGAAKTQTAEHHKRPAHKPKESAPVANAAEKPADADAKVGEEIHISPAVEPERAKPAKARADDGEDADTTVGEEPEKEDIVEKIDRVISENASKQTMLEVAKRLSAERKIYRYIFVYEYQEINPAQEQIISKLAERGNLFLVGDPKQSIYGFRACDARIFAAKTRDKERHEVIGLNRNFRSRPAILTFCNDVFSGLMTEAAGGVDYVREAMFQTGGEDDSNGQWTRDKGQVKDSGQWPMVSDRLKGTGNREQGAGIGCLSERTICHSSVSEESPSAQGDAQLKDKTAEKFPSVGGVDAERTGWPANAEKSEPAPSAPCAVNCRVIYDGGAEDEAEQIAREIEALRAQNVGYADIAILVRWLAGSYTRSLVSALTARGVPVAVSAAGGGEGVSLMLDFLRVADNRRQDIPLTAVLRGMFFRFTDAELARMRLCAPDAEFFYEAVFACAAGDAQLKGTGNREQGTGIGCYSSVSEESQPKKDKSDTCPLSLVPCSLQTKAAACLAVLDDLARVAEALPAAEFIDYAAERFRYREYLRAGKDGAAEIERFESFLRDAREIGGRLPEFLLSFEDGRADSGEPAPAADAVRLTTVHKSKGAEYPVVIFAGAGKAYTNRYTRQPALVDYEHGIALKPRNNAQLGVSGQLEGTGNREQGTGIECHSERSEESPSAQDKGQVEDDNKGQCTIHNTQLKDKTDPCPLSLVPCPWPPTRSPLNTYAQIAAALYAAELSEEVRVLYVALTRARDRLIVTGCIKEKDTGGDAETGGESALKWLLAYRSKCCGYSFGNAQLKGTGNRGQGTGIGCLSERAIYHSSVSEESPLPPIPYPPDFRYPYAADLSRPAKIAAGEMSEAQPFIAHSPLTVFHSKESGTAYHAALERIHECPLFKGQGTRDKGQVEDKSTLQSQLSTLNAFLDALVEKGALTADLRAAIDPEILALYFQSPLPALIACAERVYRERNFIYDDGGVIVQGRADLLLIEPDGITVVDYKLSGRKPDRLKAFYAGQLEIYARAASDILNRPVKGAYIYHIDTGRLL